MWRVSLIVKNTQVPYQHVISPIGRYDPFTQIHIHIYMWTNSKKYTHTYESVCTSAVKPGIYTTSTTIRRTNTEGHWAKKRRSGPHLGEQSSRKDWLIIWKQNPRDRFDQPTRPNNNYPSTPSSSRIPWFKQASGLAVRSNPTSQQQTC